MLNIEVSQVKILPYLVVTGFSGSLRAVRGMSKLRSRILSSWYAVLCSLYEENIFRFAQKLAFHEV